MSRKKLPPEVKINRLEEMKEASKVAGSIRELAKIVDLGLSTVYAILNEFPEEKNFVLEQIEMNRKEERKIIEARGNEEDANKEDDSEQKECIYMLHSSLCFIKGIESKLAKLSETSEFAITDLSLDDLNIWKKQEGIKSAAATKFYYIIQSNMSKFHYYEIRRIKKEFLTNNEVIIKFCKEKNFILLTAHIDTAVRAMLSGVKVQIISETQQDLLKHNFGEILRNLNEKGNVQNICDSEDSVEKKVENNRKNLKEVSGIEIKGNRMFFNLPTNCIAEVWDRNFSEKKEIKESIELFVGEYLLIAEKNSKYDSIVITQYEIQHTNSKLLFRKFKRLMRATDQTFNITDPIVKKFVENARKILN